MKKNSKSLPLPDTLQVGDLIRAVVFSLILGDDANVHIAARAKIVEDAGANSIANQLFALFKLMRKKEKEISKICIHKKTAV